VSTTYVQRTFRRYDFAATYWVKRKPSIFGASVRELSDEERKMIGSNSGVVVHAVIRRTPAFSADIFRGDILLSFAGERIQDGESYGKLLEKLRGKKVAVQIFRNGARLTKEVQFADPQP
jgi:S1-C subfamily serine protease